MPVVIPGAVIFLRHRKKDDGKHFKGCCHIIPTTKGENGWLFQQEDIHEFITKEAKRNAWDGYSDKDVVLDFWYISICSTSPEGFHHDQRIVIYIDDVKISSEEQGDRIVMARR